MHHKQITAYLEPDSQLIYIIVPTSKILYIQFETFLAKFVRCTHIFEINYNSKLLN